MRKDDWRLVVVGYGMGAHHARLIRDVDGLALHGVCDIAPVQLARAKRDYPGIRTYDQVEEVLADSSVEVVVPVTPHNTHAPLAIASMDAGKHVVVDKAMCLSVGEAREMIAARDRNGVLLTVFHNRRWDREFLTLRKVVADGLLGRLYHIESCVTSWARITGWRADKPQMGGWLFDWGAHTIDQILLLADSKPLRVHAVSHCRFDDPTTVEDYVSCQIAFESGLTARTVVSYLSRLPMPRWYVLGEKGTLIADDFEKPLRARTTLGTVEADVSVPLVPGEWKQFYQNVADSLNGRAELAVKPEQLIPQIAIAEAAYRSIESGQVEAVTY